MVGIAGAAHRDQVKDFLIEHSITFTTLVDYPDLRVTSHYGIGYWSEFWLLDRHGNRIGPQPDLFTTELAEQLLAQQQPPESSPRTWDLRYLTTTQQGPTYRTGPLWSRRA